jgi:hypothetical protein
MLAGFYVIFLFSCSDEKPPVPPTVKKMSGKVEGKKEESSGTSEKESDDKGSSSDATASGSPEKEGGNARPDNTVEPVSCALKPENYDAATARIGDVIVIRVDTIGPVKRISWNNTDLDMSERRFTATIENDAKSHTATVYSNDTSSTCAVNLAAGGKPAPPAAPSCTLVADPMVAKPNTLIKISMAITGTADSVKINDQTVAATNPELNVTVNSNTTYTGEVTGPGGAGKCTVNVNVDEDPVTCSLSANPIVAVAGKPVTLTMQITGTAAKAFIENQQVSSTSPQLTRSPTVSTNFNGYVESASGKKSNCSVFVTVNPKEYFIFATSRTYTGSIGDPDGGCQSAANAARLTGNYVAIISTQTVEARNRFSIDSNSVIKNLKPNDNQIVATSKTQLLSGTLTNAIRYNENGGLLNVPSGVWTMSHTGGVRAYYHCNYNSTSLSSARGTGGDASLKTAGWIQAFTQPDITCNRTASLVCIGPQ